MAVPASESNAGPRPPNLAGETGVAAGANGVGEANEGAAMVSATASALRTAGVWAETAGAGGIAGRGSGARAAGAASGQEGAMNGAGVMVVITSSNSGLALGRGFASTSRRGAAVAGRATATGATRACAAGFDALGLVEGSLPTTGLGRAATAGPFGCELGSLGPGGPIPRVVARAASAVIRGADSSNRSASETLTGSSEPKRGKPSSAAPADEKGF